MYIYIFTLCIYTRTIDVLVFPFVALHSVDPKHLEGHQRSDVPMYEYMYIPLDMYARWFVSGYMDTYAHRLLQGACMQDAKWYYGLYQVLTRAAQNAWPLLDIQAVLGCTVLYRTNETGPFFVQPTASEDC